MKHTNNIHHKFLLRFTLSIAILLVFVLALASCFDDPKSEDCTVSVGEMNWASGQILAQVSRFVLINGYDCKVEIISTATIPGIAALKEKGNPAFIPEVWKNTWSAIEASIKSGKVLNLGPVFSNGGEEFWWVPRYVSEKHNIHTLEDIIKNYKLFADPEEPSKGRFYNCPAGWACQIVNNNLFKAYGLGKNFTNFNPGSGEGLKSSIVKAFSRNEPWFGYYWGPTAVLGKYDLVALKMTQPTTEGHLCNTKENCSNPEASSYPISPVNKIATSDLINKYPQLKDFFKKFSVSNDVLNKVLAWKDKNQANGEQAAAYFMQNYKDTWQSWLEPDIATKVAKKL